MNHPYTPGIDTYYNVGILFCLLLGLMLITYLGTKLPSLYDWYINWRFNYKMDRLERKKRKGK
jgi:hypothetical protein